MRAAAMMPPDRRSGLDPAHILSVCALASGDKDDYPAQAIATTSGVRVQLGSRRAAREALPALARIGYQAAQLASPRHGRDLLVAGWSTSGLESRLVAMRAVLYRLGADPAATAAAAIGRYRQLPAMRPARAGATALGESRAQLHAWVSARSGIHAPHDPAIVSASLDNALRLHVAWKLEAAIDELIERHIRVAGHALLLFGSMRQHASDDHARQAALRWAGITFHLNGYPVHLNGYPVRQSWAKAQDAARRQRPDPPPGPSRASEGPAPAQLAAADFPKPVTDAAPAIDAAAPAARPGGRRFPARRPGRRP
jgi:hypothetical protein